MLKQNLKIRTVLILAFGLSLLCSGTYAKADDDRGDRHDDRGDGHRDHGNRYHYRNGHWYGQGEILVSDPGIGMEVEGLPPQYTTVVVGNNSYYYDKTRYYSRSPDGSYVVVENPSVVVERPSAPLIQIKL